MIAAPHVRAEPAPGPQRWGIYTEAAARAEAHELKAFDAEVEAHARWLGGLPAAQRASSRERLLRELPSDLVPDMIGEFAQAERYVRTVATGRQVSRGRRSASREGNSSAILRERVRDEEGEPPPRYLPVIPITVFVRAQDVEGALGCSRATAYEHLRQAARRPEGTRGMLRVPVAVWEAYVKEKFQCRSEVGSTSESKALPGGAGTTRAMASGVSDQRDAPTAAPPRRSSASSNVMPLIRLTQPRARPR